VRAGDVRVMPANWIGELVRTVFVVVVRLFCKLC
jgi:hypothetical protein